MKASLPDDDTSAYKNFAVLDKAAQALRKGRNVIAVHMQRTLAGDGDQFIDAGLRAPWSNPTLASPSAATRTRPPGSWFRTCCSTWTRR
ncbi:MAG: hypothetical protein R2724_22275 [Bryobacterales bacterium]